VVSYDNNYDYVQSGMGHAVFVYYDEWYSIGGNDWQGYQRSKSRENTAGPDVNLSFNGKDNHPVPHGGTSPTWSGAWDN